MFLKVLRAVTTVTGRPGHNSSAEPFRSPGRPPCCWRVVVFRSPAARRSSHCCWPAVNVCGARTAGTRERLKNVGHPRRRARCGCRTSANRQNGETANERIRRNVLLFTADAVGIGGRVAGTSAGHGTLSNGGGQSASERRRKDNGVITTTRSNKQQ